MTFTGSALLPRAKEKNQIMIFVFPLPLSGEKIIHAGKRGFSCFPEVIVHSSRSILYAGMFYTRQEAFCFRLSSFMCRLRIPHNWGAALEAFLKYQKWSLCRPCSS